MEFSCVCWMLCLGAFFTALGVACYTHYYKIVQNEYFGYPDVSNTGRWENGGPCV